MLNTTDTICAVATCPGQGGVGVIRCSGPDAFRFCQIFTGCLPPARIMTRCDFFGLDGTVIDNGLVVSFSAPASFTGEDVVEFHTHGSPMVLQMLVEELLTSGARLARPGEFTERAFLNGKIDLLQAEAVADLIVANSRAAAHAAAASLKGEFSKKVYILVDAFLSTRAQVEASIDFSDEDIEFIQNDLLKNRLLYLENELSQLINLAENGKRVKDGLRVVIVGFPNVGKSTFLNALVGDDVAIVTSIPGTTRDPIRQEILLKGTPVFLVDTAGLRESTDPVEEEGIRRALAAVEDANHVLVMLDDSGESGPVSLQFEYIKHQLSTIQRKFDGDDDFEVINNRLTRVLTKIDETGTKPGFSTDALGTVIGISALSGQGMQEIREYLHGLASDAVADGAFSARTRHVHALQQSLNAIKQAQASLVNGYGELVAEELRQGQQALGKITGAVYTDDLLGEIFSRFCIGK